MFTYKVSFVITGISIEVRGNDDSLDAIFKGYILGVIFVKVIHKVIWKL